VVVKGKTEPVSVYEILDFHNEESFPNLDEVAGHFKADHKFYRACEFDRAIRQFSDALELNPSDALSQTYVGRCEEIKADPPEKPWNGVRVMKTK